MPYNIYLLLNIFLPQHMNQYFDKEYQAILRRLTQQTKSAFPKIFQTL